MVAVEVRQGTLSADDRSCRLTLGTGQHDDEGDEGGRGRRRGGGSGVS